MTLLQVNSLKKIYTTRFGGNQVEALKDVNFTVEKGEFVAIMGESGSGKTTLLNILASLDKPTSGDVILEGQNQVKIKDSEITKYRRENLGFVFQDFNLLDNFCVKDNIFLPLVLSQTPLTEMEKRLEVLAKQLNIEGILKKFPYEISGGQKQRVAVARALITNPKIVLADEPTGALDSKSSDQLLNIFKSINDTGETFLMVTHSAQAASRASRVLFIKDGIIFHQLYKANMNNEQMFAKIQDALLMLQNGGVINA